MEPPKEFRDVLITLENSIIPQEAIESTPSRKEGIPEDLEKNCRLIGCDFIHSTGVLLDFPQVSIATAQVLFQRFFYAKSFLKYNVQYMAAACIFLAGKIEESPRRLRDIVNVFNHIKQKRMNRPATPMEFASTQYFNIKNSIIKYERVLLKELGFCVHVKHPHKTIITYLNTLGKSDNNELIQKCWNFMNDSLRTNVFVRYPPETVACACIFLAARLMEIPLPEEPGWWLLFDAEYDALEDISLEILELYQKSWRTIEETEREIALIKESQNESKGDSKITELSSSSRPLSGDDSPRSLTNEKPLEIKLSLLGAVDVRQSSRGPSPLTLTHQTHNEPSTSQSRSPSSRRRSRSRSPSSRRRSRSRSPSARRRSRSRSPSSRRRSRSRSPSSRRRSRSRSPSSRRRSRSRSPFMSRKDIQVQMSSKISSNHDRLSNSEHNLSDSGSSRSPEDGPDPPTRPIISPIRVSPSGDRARSHNGRSVTDYKLYHKRHYRERRRNRTPSPSRRRRKHESHRYYS